MEFKHRKELSEPPFSLVLSDTELWDLIRAGRLQPFTKVQPSMQYFPTDPLSGDPAYEPLFPRPIAEKYERFRFLQQQIDIDQKFIDKSEDQVWKEHQEILRFDYYGQTVLARITFLSKGSKPLKIYQDDYYGPTVLVNKDTFEKTKDLDFERKLEAKREPFLADRETLKEKTRQGLEANKKEAAELEKEFEDLPKLYEAFMADIASDREREDFVRELNDAYFPREHIEGVIEARITEDLEAEHGLKVEAQAQKEKPMKRQRRYHKEQKKARSIAEELIEKNPNIIKADVIKRLRRKVTRPDKCAFLDKTYRKWIDKPFKELKD